MSATAYHVTGLPKNREKFNFHIMELSVTLHVNLSAPEGGSIFLETSPYFTPPQFNDRAWIWATRTMYHVQMLTC